MRVALCKIGNAVDCGADHRSSFVDDLLHAGLCSIGAIGCRFTACSLRRRARPGCGTVAFLNILFLPPPGKPVGAALAGSGCTCILCRSRLPCRKFCGFGALLVLHLGFLFQLPGVSVLGNIPDISCRLFALAQRLHADVFILVLVNLPMCRRSGGSSGIHSTFLLLCHAGCFIRGDLGFAKTQVLRLFRSFICVQFQLLLFGLRLLHFGLFRRRARGRALLFLLEFQLRLFLTHAFAPPQLRKGGS